MRINEIFYSLQGEGHFAGTPAVFVRFSGCNLRCWFCDTDHQGHKDMSEEDILLAIKAYPARHVVLTGGEPLLQMNRKLTDLLHKSGYYVQMETNGTIPLKEGISIDWITCSPKDGHEVILDGIDEIKAIFTGDNQQELEDYLLIPATQYRLQPCDVRNEVRNKEILEGTIDFVLRNPMWRLSLQTHKLIDIR